MELKTLFPPLPSMRAATAQVIAPRFVVGVVTMEHKVAGERAYLCHASIDLSKPSPLDDFGIIHQNRLNVRARRRALNYFSEAAQRAIVDYMKKEGANDDLSS